MNFLLKSLTILSLLGLSKCYKLSNSELNWALDPLNFDPSELEPKYHEKKSIFRAPNRPQPTPFYTTLSTTPPLGIDQDFLLSRLRENLDKRRKNRPQNPQPHNGNKRNTGPKRTSPRPYMTTDEPSSTMTIREPLEDQTDMTILGPEVDLTTVKSAKIDLKNSTKNAPQIDENQHLGQVDQNMTKIEEITEIDHEITTKMPELEKEIEITTLKFDETTLKMSKIDQNILKDPNDQTLVPKIDEISSDLGPEIIISSTLSPKIDKNPTEISQEILISSTLAPKIDENPRKTRENIKSSTLDPKIDENLTEMSQEIVISSTLAPNFEKNPTEMFQEIVISSTLSPKIDEISTQINIDMGEEILISSTLTPNLEKEIILSPEIKISKN